MQWTWESSALLSSWFCRRHHEWSGSGLLLPLEKTENRFREHFEVVELRQSCVHTDDVHMCIRMNEYVAKPHHLHERRGKVGGKYAGVAQEFDGLWRAFRCRQSELGHEVLTDVD